MKTVILIMSSHGCTIDVAHQLRGQLSGDVSILNLKEKQSVDLNDFDRVIIGGSIHAGKIQKKIRAFCEENLNELCLKETGLFVCCMYEGEIAQMQFQQAFPEKLQQCAKATSILGGALNFEKMNFWERYAIRKITGFTESTNHIKHDSVNNFAARMNATIPNFMWLH